MHPESAQPLQQPDLIRLDQFLRSSACGKQAMSLSYAHGFLTSIASGPEQLEPSEWLRLMFDEPVFESGDEGSEMLGLAVRLFAEIERGLKNETIFRPVLEYIRDGDKLVRTDAQRWCLGFVEGLGLFNERWTPDARESLRTPLEVVFQLAEIRGVANPSYQQLCDTLPDIAQSTFSYWQAAHKQAG
jgi:uncharacterized protein